MQSSLSNFGNFLSPSSQHTLVRLAKIDDINDIGDVLTFGFNDFNRLTLWIYPFLKLGVCEDLRSRLKNEENYACIIAEKQYDGKENDRQIIGTVELSLRTIYGKNGRKKYPYIANLAVSKKYRRHGVGTQLLLKCEQIAKHWGFNQVYLHVLANNRIGQKLYLHNKYTIERVETDLFSLFVPSKRRLLLGKSL